MVLMGFYNICNVIFDSDSVIVNRKLAELTEFQKSPPK